MRTLISQNLKGARAVVIGAGPSGLAAAIGLATRGARVRVLERSLDPSPLRGDPPGPGDRSIEMPWIFGRLFAMADLRLTDFVRFEPVDPLMRIRLPGGDGFDVHRDPGALAAEIGQRDADDGRRLAAMLESAEGLRAVAEDAWFGEPRRRGLGGSGGGMGGARGLSVRLAMARRSTLEARMRRRFNHPAARALFHALADRMGACPGTAGSGLVAPLATVLLKGFWRPEGSLDALMAAMERVAVLRGARIMRGAEVERIETADGAARRVLGEGFRPLRIEIVVSTIGPLATAHLLASSDAEKRAARMMAEFSRRQWACWRFSAGAAASALLAGGETYFDADDHAEASRQVDLWRVPAAVPAIRVHDEGGGEFSAWVDAAAPSPSFRWSEANAAAERNRLAARMEALGAAKLEAEGESRSFHPPAAGGPSRLVAVGRLGAARRPSTTWPGIRGLYQAGREAHPGPTLSLRVLGGALAAQAAADDAS